MISPLRASASLIPSSLLPEAVGPTITGINWFVLGAPVT